MSFGLMIEMLVAILLMLTIGYCYTLNRRLERLRGDEQVLEGDDRRIDHRDRDRGTRGGRAQARRAMRMTQRLANASGRPSAAASSSIARSPPATSC